MTCAIGAKGVPYLPFFSFTSSFVIPLFLLPQNVMVSALWFIGSPHLHVVLLVLILTSWPTLQMCEQAAEAQKSKGALARRGRTSSEPIGSKRDSISVDAILSKKSSTSVLVSSIILFVYHVHRNVNPLELWLLWSNLCTYVLVINWTSKMDSLFSFCCQSPPHTIQLLD